ncbi:hypothetical protein BV22DRAFT_1046609 [Leucogyrophana mollusca]|uniref:Uncharacterized protein n=1 Tax=Leucogyrophana mollusca TaxID=85980 RepID=A0ACB8BJB3_9AGAM|nr:hypothetical protein BV22DRAFT_1046609 [Leucogyrophana mollusca]
MYSRFLTVLPFALLVVAQAPCPSGTLIKCCNGVEKPRHVQNVLKQIGLADVIGPNDNQSVGISCIGPDNRGGSPHCYQRKALCCIGDLWNGLILSQCDPITLP